MSAGVAITVVVAVFVLTWLLTALLVVAARRLRILDHPNERSSHVVATPRGGGLAIVVVVLAVLLALPFFGLETPANSSLAFSSALIAAVGLVDDLVDVRASIRMLIHVCAAALIVYAGWGLLSADTPGRGIETYPLLALTVIAIVWVLNLFNFMDGIDGIAASESLFVSLAAAWFLFSQGAEIWLLTCVAIAAASAAFLTFNWSPARIFMGDVGSGFLGFILAAVATLSWLDGSLSPAVWIILGGAFVVDATYTLVVRMTTGQRWLSPHRSHVYQKLSRKLSSHSKTTSIYICVNVLWLFPMAWLALRFPEFEWWVVAGSLTPLGVAAIHFRGGVPDAVSA